PCRSAMPVLQELEKKYASKGLKVISINQEEPPATVRAFVKEIGYEPLVLLDPKGVTGEEYSVSSIPTLVLVDKSGKVAYAAEGLQPMSTFITEQEVCKALGIKYKPRAFGGGARYERH
ncbi:MAG: TlpA disulfide reductase family protein, partial [Armatimonadetes bacterium]|nr:TlpA disulfide reductase family protein [Armatimonadota bacterium]